MHLPSEESCPIYSLAPYKNNARTHSKKQLCQIADSIERSGFTNQVLVSDDNMIIAIHGRVEAAKLIGMRQVPVRRQSHLNKDEARACILAYNRLAENAGWDKDLMAIEFQALIDLDFDIELLGFSAAEIDLAKVNELLLKAKPNWLSIASDGAREMLISGDAVAGMIWNEMGPRARTEKASLQYAYPIEGLTAWADNMVVLKGAPNLENAKLFLDFMLEPENAAALTNFASYIAGVEGTEPFLD